MKQYQGEKAIISLTSWKARIKTVGLTIYSLLTQCPGFHIVLVLSEEEFPKKEAELPEDLVLMSRCGKIEILWVYRNYKSFKKVLFTMDKYRDVPIISADDDCIYTCNYAELLYRRYINNPRSIITHRCWESKMYKWTEGPNTLFYPNCFCNKLISAANHCISKKFYNDDALYAAYFHINKIPIISCNDTEWFVFHDELNALSSTYKYNADADITNAIMIIKSCL